MQTRVARDLGKKTTYLMNMQDLTGVYFDTEAALPLWESIQERIEEIRQEVEPLLPEAPLNKTELKKCTPPKTQFKNSKEGPIPSSYAERFFDKCYQRPDGSWVGEKEGGTFVLPFNEPVRTTGPMLLKHQKEMKNWLQSLGWEPTMWNFKRDEKGKIVYTRSGPIKTTPKFHDKGELCPNLERLTERADISFLPLIIEYLSIKNRLSVLWNPEEETGWIANPRLEKDHRLPSSSGGLALSMRQMHRVVANIPRPSSRLGKEFRGLFRAAPGFEVVGYDADGLEARVEGHWTYRYDKGEYARELIDGDVHTKNAIVFYDLDIPDGEEAEAKYRNPSKNGKYALTYGASAPRLASTLNVPEWKAEELYDNFWEQNWALKRFQDALRASWHSTGKKEIEIPLTGYKLPVRAEHALVNTVFQHTGAIIMDIAGCYMDSWLGGIRLDKDLPYYLLDGHEVRRTIYYHDEYMWESRPEVTQKLLDMGCASIVMAGEFLKLNVPLTASGSIGQNWGDVH